MRKEKTPKIRMPWKEFEENYVAVEAADHKKGHRIQYVYVGEWYVWKQEARELVIRKLFLAFLTMGITLSFFGGALYPSPLNLQAGIDVSIGFAFAAWIFVVFGVAQFIASNRKLNKLSFSDIEHKIRIATPVLAFFLFLAAVFSTITLWKGNYGGNDRIPLLLFLLSGAGALLLYYTYTQIGYLVQKNTALDQIDASSVHEQDTEA